MSVEKSHWEGRLCEMRVKYEATNSSLQARLDTYEKRQQHQSKSTFTTALMTTLDGIDDINALDENEKRIFDEIQRLVWSGSNDDDEDNRIYTVTESAAISTAQNSQSIIVKNDWINLNHADNEKLPATAVTVQWQHQDASQITSNISNDDAFMLSIFNKMSPASQDGHLSCCQIPISKTVSSIMAVIRKSKHDDELLFQSINDILQNTVAGEQPQQTDESIINNPSLFMPSHRSEHLSKKDSLLIAHEHEKRVS